MNVHFRALALVAAAFAWVAGAAADDETALRMKPCAACHGDQGRATPDGYYPRIAGKPAGYLYEQLLNFRDGRRINAQMSFLVDRQQDAYLRELADAFAALDIPYPAPLPAKGDATQLARGEALVRHGDRARRVPPCADCHGDRLTGLAPGVPGLLGLPYDYLAAQLGAWREGGRHARSPDCMEQVARRLAPEDLQAAAAWLAAQPVPADSHAPAGKIRADLRCGSVEPHS